MPNNQSDNTIEIEIKDENDLKELEKHDADENTANESLEGKKINESLQPQLDGSPDYYDLYLRVQAEFQNYKRRSEQRMQEWKLYAAKEIILQLLPVIDDFDILFSHHNKKTEDICVDGVKMIYTKMLSSLTDFGLEPIEANGKEFDPSIHEAIMAEESDDIAEGHILKVWQRGFMYKGTLLRPAKVITAKAKQNGAQDGK